MQLVCLLHLENLNALFIQEKTPQTERLGKLNQIAIQQMRLLTGDGRIKRLEAGVVVSFGMGSPYETLVIPAQAGIHSNCGALAIACAVDSRLRGNDGECERCCLPNDTTTEAGDK